MSQPQIGTSGFVDSASLYEVVAALEHPHPEACYEWAWTTARAVTGLLMFTDHIGLSPGVYASRTASGPYGELLDRLAAILNPATSLSLADKAAITRTKRWAYDNPEKIRARMGELQSDAINYARWLDWVVNRAWLENVHRMHGLFSPNFVPEIARILRIPVTELEELQKLSSKPREIKAVIRRDDRSGALFDAYLAGALMRGRCHDYVARDLGMQVMHHPLRRGVLLRKRSSDNVTLDLSDTEQQLANLILAAAYSEPQAWRIQRWATNIMKVREARARGVLELDKSIPISLRDSQGIVERTARILGIQFHPVWLERVALATATLTASAGTSFVLSPWAGFAVGAAAAVLSAVQPEYGRRGVRRSLNVITQRPARLRALMSAGPGNIEVPQTAGYRHD